MDIISASLYMKHLYLIDKYIIDIFVGTPHLNLVYRWSQHSLKYGIWMS